MGINEDAKENIGSPRDNLHHLLIDLREPKKLTRQALHEKILKILNYPKRLTVPQMDAFLIKAVYETFGDSTTEADIVLMALGLLDGYNYRSEPKIMERRAEYLRKSEYLSYNNAIEKTQKHYRDNLRKSEDPRLLQLAEFLLSLRNNVDSFLSDIDNYMDGKSRANLPTPSYIERKRLQDETIVVVRYLVSGRNFLTTEQKSPINKDNKCEVKIDLAKSFPGLASALICIILIFSLTHYRQVYRMQDERESNGGYAIVQEVQRQDYEGAPLAKQEGLSDYDN